MRWQAIQKGKLDLGSPLLPLARTWKRRPVLGPLRQRAAHVGANWQVCLALDPPLPSDAACPGVSHPHGWMSWGMWRSGGIVGSRASHACNVSLEANDSRAPTCARFWENMLGEALPSTPAIVCLAMRGACSFSHPPGWMSGACCSAVAWQSVVC